jgi:hypothetical protein
MIFYLHVPKTGGQSLAARLASAFPAGRADIMGAELSADSRKHVIARFDSVTAEGEVVSICG